MGAAPVIMKRTRPPRLACEDDRGGIHTLTKLLFAPQNAGVGAVLALYLDLPEDESIPDAVPSHDASP